MWWRNWWNKDWQGNLKYSEKICPISTLSTTNPTWLDPDLNPGRRGRKPATNRLRYGAALRPRLRWKNSIKIYRNVWRSGGTAPPFLTSTLDGGEWSASRPASFTPVERAPGIHWIGGRVDPRAGLDDVEKRKFLTVPGLELQSISRSACSHSLYRLLYPDSPL
jgi:hypothetical protein